MEDGLFTKIIKGEIPCHKIYEDELTFAFLDIYPIQPGHILVIPKKQIEFIWDLDDETYQAVMKTTKMLANRVKEVMNPKYVGLKVMGEGVPHAHVHIVPFSIPDQFHNRPDHSIEPNHEELDKIAKQLAIV